MSPVDSSIIAVITKYPDMSDAEIESILDKLQDQSLRNIGMALAGRIADGELSDDELATVEEHRAVHAEKTGRVRNEEIDARRKNVLTPLARNLLKLHEEGKISEDALIVYGVSGDIPVRHPRLHRDLTQEEKTEIFRERMRRRYGDDWERRFPRVPAWLRHRKEWRVKSVDWSRDGF